MLALLFACTASTPTSDPIILPAKEQRGPFQIIRLAGSPYEMGQQHGELLLEELEIGADYIADDPLLGGMLTLAELQGLIDFAYEHADPQFIEECQGMTSVSDIVGWSMDHCMVLNYGDIIIERLLNPPEQTPGCSQIILQQERTESDSMLHGRILDWEQIDFIIENPIIFVRSPENGIPHVTIGFPGNLSPYQGMSMAGLSIASNEAHPQTVPLELHSGDSHVQMVSTLLSQATNIDEASQMLNSIKHSSTESILIADGDHNQAAAFEMTHDYIERREPFEHMLFQTNHFIGEHTSNLDREPSKEDSLKRYDRIAQLLPAEQQLNAQQLKTILQDRMDPWSGLESPLGTFDDGMSVATNGALFAIVFEPTNRHFYVASGDIPVPEQQWYGFSLYQLLGEEDPNPVSDFLP